MPEYSRSFRFGNQTRIQLNSHIRDFFVLPSSMAHLMKPSPHLDFTRIKNNFLSFHITKKGKIRHDLTSFLIKKENNGNFRLFVESLPPDNNIWQNKHITLRDDSFTFQTLYHSSILLLARHSWLNSDTHADVGISFFFSDQISYRAQHGDGERLRIDEGNH